MFKQNYLWDFPLNSHEEMTTDRQTRVQQTLKEIRKDRDQDKTYRKQKEIALKKYGHMRSSLGFAAASMLGITGEQEIISSGIHTRPANFIMSKQQENQKYSSDTIYDDTGRGLQTLKVHKLLEKAKQVIAHENKKAHKEMMKNTQGPMAGRKRTGLMDMSQGTTANQTKSKLMGMTGGVSGAQVSDYDDEEEDERDQAQKIKPFSFDIDDDIDTEVLTNEQVHDDLKEILDILDESQKDSQQVAMKSNYGMKMKRRA